MLTRKRHSAYTIKGLQVFPVIFIFCLDLSKMAELVLSESEKTFILHGVEQNFR